MPNIGYGSNKKTKHMLSSGFLKFVVHNVSDLNMLLMHNRCVTDGAPPAVGGGVLCSWAQTGLRSSLRQEILRGGGAQRVHAEAQGDCGARAAAEREADKRGGPPAQPGAVEGCGERDTGGQTLNRLCSLRRLPSWPVSHPCCLSLLLSVSLLLHFLSLRQLRQLRQQLRQLRLDSSQDLVTVRLVALIPVRKTQLRTTAAHSCSRQVENEYAALTTWAG